MTIFYIPNPIQYLNLTTILKYYNYKNIIEHQISIVEWFLKDYITLKTGNSFFFSKQMSKPKSFFTILQFYCILIK